MEGFLCYKFGELVFGGANTHGWAYFQNFTVFNFHKKLVLKKIEQFQNIELVGKNYYQHSN